MKTARISIPRRIYAKDGTVIRPSNNLYDTQNWVHTYGNCEVCFGCGPISYEFINDCEVNYQPCHYRQFIYKGLVLDARSVTQFCENKDIDRTKVVRSLEGEPDMLWKSGLDLKFYWQHDCPHLIQYKFLVKTTFDVDLDEIKKTDKAVKSAYDIDL